MAKPALIVLGYSEASMLLRNGDTKIAAIITIAGEREFAVATDGTDPILRLHFDDVEVPDPSDPLSAARAQLRQREEAKPAFWPVQYCRIDDERVTRGAPPHAPPTPDDAQRIIDFARSLDETDGVILCQCHAGISRSPAVALLCLATWAGPAHEDACVQRLKAIRPCAVPHRGLVRFGDERLGRGGALIAALDRIGCTS